MTPEKLIHMANEIAAFFRVYPSDEAQAGIREHIHAFWTPGMRADLEKVVAAGGAGLSPAVLAAVQGTDARDRKNEHAAA